MATTIQQPRGWVTPSTSRRLPARRTVSIRLATEVSMGTPQISTPQDELGDVPPVRTTMFRGLPYLQILGHANEPVLDLTLTDALNLAMLLIEHAGEGMNRRIAGATAPSTDQHESPR